MDRYRFCIHSRDSTEYARSIPLCKRQAGRMRNSLQRVRGSLRKEATAALEYAEERRGAEDFGHAPILAPELPASVTFESLGVIQIRQG